MTGNDDETFIERSGDDRPGDDLLRPGVMLDRYRVERLLGRGGMGAVYLAEHVLLDQRYALKVLPREMSLRGDFAQRFVNEGRRLARLRHPGIVPIHYSGKGLGLHFFAMEYVAGGDLAQRQQAAGGRLAEAEVAAILRQLLEVLAYAHGEGVIHRDLKPANILVEGGEGADIRIKVTDFGLAEVLGEGYMQSLVERTMTASLLDGAETLIDNHSGSKGSSELAGTIHYMAPEVLQRGPSTQQSDLYAVGVIGYNLLTGRVPAGRYKDASKLVNGLNPLWDDFLNALMDQDPEDRTASALAALEMLPKAHPVEPGGSDSSSNESAEPEPVPTASVNSAAKADEHRKQNSGRGRWLIAAAIAVIMAAIGWWTLTPIEEEPEEPMLVGKLEFIEDEPKLHAAVVEPAVVVVDTGGLIVRSEPSGAKVIIDNEVVQTTPAVFTGMSSGGRHLALELDGYQRVEQRVEVRAGEVIELPVFPLRRLTGALLVETIPKNALIRLQGPEGVQREGKSPEAFSNLPTGAYQITASLPPFFGQKQQQVAVESDVTTSTKINLSEQDYRLELPQGQVLDLVWLEAGQFTMGSPSDEPGRNTDEGPPTEVELSRGFWIGKYPVTVGQWKSVMGSDLRDQVRKALEDDALYVQDGQSQTMRDRWSLERDSDPGIRVGNSNDALPMHYVSWYDAMEFCRLLNEREQAAGRLPEGYFYTLPSEAQWEYAARAGTQTATYAGAIEILGRNNVPVLDAIAWYAGNSSVGYQGRGWQTDGWEEKQYPGRHAGPRNVGEKAPNPWGLHDMLGNVLEWTRSSYGRYPGGSVVDFEDPASGVYRIYRGGSWNTNATFNRAAARPGNLPSYRNNHIGFRLALAPE